MSFAQLAALIGESQLVKLRSAIVADLKAAMPFIKTVEEYGGQFSGSDVRRVSSGHHAIYASIMGAPTSGGEASGQRMHKVAVSLFVLATKVGKISRDDAALAIAENCATLAHVHRWTNWEGRLSFPDQVKIARIGANSLEAKGVTLMAVTWQQNVALGVDQFAHDPNLPLTMGAVDGGATIGDVSVYGVGEGEAP